MAMYVEFENSPTQRYHVDMEKVDLLCLYRKFAEVTQVQADGDELARCLAILGRSSSPCRVHTFIGESAKEIARNWR
jgi:hypothetical protein